MNYENLKIKDSEISTQGVVAAPDRLTGTAQENKAVFDRLIKAVMAKKFNSFLDQFQEEFESLIEEIEESEKTRIEETVKLIKQYLEENPQFADWAEWDENKSSHVKNRTHYKQVLYPCAMLLNNVSLDFKFEMMELAGLGTDDVAEGVEYTVTWNGAKYKCKAYTYGGSVCLGNAALLGSSGNSGEPFVFEMMGADRCLLMKNSSAAVTIILSVERHEFVELKKLDAEFLPDNLLAVESAEVGQIVVVEAVDENGKPIKWKAIDLSVTDGKDGYSPTVAISDISGGHRIAITDASGTKTVDVMDGAKGDTGIQGPKGDTGATGPQGEKGSKGDKGDTGPQGEKGNTGAQGEKGKDGVSATHQWSGTTLKVTSASGTSSADLKGAKGDKGDTGETGPQGPQGAKGETGATGPQGDKGDRGNAVFYSTETFPDVEIGFGRLLSVDAISLAGRTIQLNDMVLTEDGLLWNVSDDYVSKEGTILAKCISNLRGAADAQGYSIYYSSEVCPVAPTIGHSYGMNYADIQLSDRPLTENDLIVTADGYLWRVRLCMLETVSAFCIGNIKGVTGDPGRGIYYSNQVIGTPKIGNNCRLTFADVVLGNRALYGGDLIITADGYLLQVYTGYVNEVLEDFSATCLACLPRQGLSIRYTAYNAGNVAIGDTFWVIDVDLADSVNPELPVKKGDLIVTADSYLCRVTDSHGNGNVRVTCLGNIKGDPGGVTTVNGIAPDANGNVQIETVGGVFSWNDLPAPMPKEFLPDGVPYMEKSFLLDETDAVEDTDPNFGKCWLINKAPMLTTGETYTVIYNGVSYDCVCDTGERIGYKGAFIMGNTAAIGGANTGEPFAMMIMPTQQIVTLDLTGATSVRFGIMGWENVLNVFVDTSDASNLTADKNIDEIWQAVRENKEVYLYFATFICRLVSYYPGQCAVFAYPAVAYTSGKVDSISGLEGIIITQDGSVRTS